MISTTFRNLLNKNRGQDRLQIGAGIIKSRWNYKWKKEGLQIGADFRDYKSGQERLQIGAKGITTRGRDYISGFTVFCFLPIQETHITFSTYTAVHTLKSQEHTKNMIKMSINQMLLKEERICCKLNFYQVLNTVTKITQVFIMY